MPIGDDLETKEIDGRWFVVWGDDKAPLCCPNEPYAVGLGIAAQWAAQKMMEKLGEK